MMDAPKTKAEFFRRARVVPWYTGCISLVVAMIVAGYFLFIQSPPEQRGRNTSADLRMVYAAIVGVAGLGMFGWGFISSRRWSALSRRGAYAAIEEFRPGVSKRGAQACRVVYRVNGNVYTIARDLPADNVAEICDQLDAASVIYDPQNPSSAEILTPRIASLPDA